MVIVRDISHGERDVKSVVTVGTFDGVHRGHRRIIDRMKEIAAATGGRTVVVTFDPHPQIVLNKAGREPIKLLSSMNERLRLLAEANVDMVVVIPFTFEFANTGAEDFILKLLHKHVGIGTFLVGYDHTFGRNREGNEEMLRSLGATHGFTVECIEPLMLGEVKVSSTQIRNALKEHRLADANDMLGTAYTVEGIVVEGDGRGRRLGYPTANVECLEQHKLLPANGVYCVSAVIDNMQRYGMANIGTRPTFTDDIHPRLEAHFFDYNGVLYNRRIAVCFHSFVRREMKFDSIDMFWSQLRDDREACEAFIADRLHGAASTALTEDSH
ncbi:MAG: riboflavin biosynthesis protein RibF [Candidatus Kapaibacterium sp.]